MRLRNFGTHILRSDVAKFGYGDSTVLDNRVHVIWTLPMLWSFESDWRHNPILHHLMGNSLPVKDKKKISVKELNQD